ncbi:hypothetical protein FB45DRAFT_454532 [Roridomyces roridus]|uniref:Uncharacterized protein n=1 Tax=Roridomyces roridus TaxID=1738132 RepID=A0AAD7C2D4_9AGAR|nr:hypothetical protein FB45DRAFT_454532 [Roridomyces roridus]
MSMSTKRHSLPVGPRPLQLASGPVSDGPLSAVSAYSPSPLTPTSPATPNRGSRRPSSIIYNPSSRPDRGAGHRSTLSRSSSLDQRRHTVAVDRSPVTLAEKHADLLHFIAQKESKCLELRSQLAVHEGELLQLKRKWERIVSRGFTSPHNSSFASSSSGTASGSSIENSPIPTSANGGAVLDGIREGVQGVGRFIAALSPTPYSSFESVLPHATHSPSSSMSTMTTSSASKSTRLSQSSVSSIGEEPAKDEPTDDAQVLMVHDTGATPTVSPNPVFTMRQQREQLSSPDSSAEAEDAFFLANAQAATSTPADTGYSGQTDIQQQPRSRAWQWAWWRASRLYRRGLVLLSGKKWEELQRAPTFAKNSKRASLLFSDIAHALQVGPPPPSSPSPTPSMSSTSLLDDDDASMMPDAPALTPAPVAALPLSARATRQQQPQSPLSVSKSRAPPPLKQAQAPPAQDDDDDEWNW